MGRRFDIAALGLTQIVGYGTLYYGFATLAPAMGRDFGWPTDRVFAAFSVALLVGGLLAPRSGRWIDRHGAGRVMSVGSGLAAAALAAAALAPTGSLFVAGLIGAQIAAVLVQYGAAFPLLVQRHGASARRSIVHLTLIAGFASTIFWPLTHWLHGFLDWRAVYLAFAALHLGLCLPLHLGLCRGGVPSPPPPAETAPRRAAPIEPPLPAERRGRGFVLMALAFSLQSFLGAAVLVHMLPVLGALGLGVVGVAIGAMFGPAQVASRLINMIFGENLSQLALAAISAALLPGGVAVLLATAPSPVGAMVFAVLFGMGNGLFSIVGGTLPLTLFGPGGYGARQGQVTAIRLVVGAVSPFVFALAIESFGVRPALAVAATIGTGAVVALAAIGRLAAKPAA